MLKSTSIAYIRYSGNFYDSTVVQETKEVLNNFSASVDYHWAAIKKASISAADQIVDGVPKGRHKVWLTVHLISITHTQCAKFANWLAKLIHTHHRH